MRYIEAGLFLIIIANDWMTLIFLTVVFKDHHAHQLLIAIITIIIVHHFQSISCLHGERHHIYGTVAQQALTSALCLWPDCLPAVRVAWWLSNLWPPEVLSDLRITCSISLPVRWTTAFLKIWSIIEHRIVWCFPMFSKLRKDSRIRWLQFLTSSWRRPRSHRSPLCRVLAFPCTVLSPWPMRCPVTCWTPDISATKKGSIILQTDATTIKNLVNTRG